MYEAGSTMSNSGCLVLTGDRHTYGNTYDAPSQAIELAKMKSFAAVLSVCADKDVQLLVLGKIHQAVHDPSKHVMVHQAGIIQSVVRLADGQAGPVQSAALNILITLSSDTECCKVIAQLWRPAAEIIHRAMPQMQQFHQVPATYVSESSEAYWVPHDLSVQSAPAPRWVQSCAASSIASEEQMSPEGEYDYIPKLHPASSSQSEDGAPRRRRWDRFEDERLLQAVQCVGFSWSKVAAMLEGRTGKQCRERWKNHLREGLRKGAWSEDEAKRFHELFEIHGPKWTVIAEHLPGRTDNAVKNFCHAVYGKKHA